MSYERYIRQMSDEVGFLAAWPPFQTLNLGDVGTLRNGSFEKQTTLSRLGVAFETEEAGTRGEMKHQSGDGLDFHFDAGATAGASQARAVFQFKTSGAFYFHAVKCSERSIADRVGLRDELRLLAAEQRWERDWVVVDRLITASSATVLVCTSDSGGVTLAAKVPVAAQGFDLADASLGLAAVASSGSVTQVLASRDLTPLYRASKLKFKAIFGGPGDLDVVHFRGGPDAAELSVRTELEPVGIDELLGG